MKQLLEYTAIILACLAGLFIAFSCQALEDPEDNTIWHNRIIGEVAYGPASDAIGADRELNYGARYEPSYTVFLPAQEWPDWTLFTRLWFTYNSSDSQQAPLISGESEPIGATSVELREFSAQRSVLVGDPRLSAKIGRQRFSDRFGFWWDDSLEALMVRFDGEDNSGFLALGERFFTYNSDENDLSDREQSILYALAEYNFLWRSQHWIGTRLLYEHDHSGSSDSSQDSSDFQGGRLGIHAFGSSAPSISSSVDYYLQAMLLNGEFTNVTDLSRRNEGSINGWAFVSEIGLTLFDVQAQPRLGVRLGLTDEPDTQADGFFLNSIQSDRASFQGTSSGLISQFVAIDLNNVLFYGVLLEMKPFDRNRIQLRSFALEQRQVSAQLPFATNQSAITRDTGKHLGTTLEVSYYWTMFPVAVNERQLSCRSALHLGYFMTGDAFQNAPNEIQAATTLELNF
jgi:alginate production protein